MLADKKATECSVKIAQLLIDNKCDPTAKDSEGMTALMYAVQQVGEAATPKLSAPVNHFGIIIAAENIEF